MWSKGFGESLNMGSEENLKVRHTYRFRKIFDKLLVFEFLIHLFSEENILMYIYHFTLRFLNPTISLRKRPNISVKNVPSCSLTIFDKYLTMVLSH